MHAVRWIFPCFCVLLLLSPPHARAQADSLDHRAHLNINTHFIRIHDFGSAGAGGGAVVVHSYPVRGATGIYDDDELIGGYLLDSGNRRLWVTGSYYYGGLAPGTLLSGDSPKPGRVYRLRKDFPDADLRQDAADTYSIPLESVTQANVDALRLRYAADLHEWPTAYGAPFDDRDGNGVRDPGEEPGFLDADMVVWMVATDLSSPALFACQPVGLETQITWWGYRGHRHALGNSIFVRYLMIFRGTEAMNPEARLDSLYITKYSEVDLGNSGDDLMGCDTTLGLGFIYNGNSQDSELLKFGITIPHTLGYSLLRARTFPQGGLPQDLHMSSFFVKSTGVSFSDPPGGEEGGKRMYRWMRGYLPDPSTTPLRTWGVDTEGHPRFFVHSGDPVTGQGDLDGLGTEYSTAPGNRRFLMNVGPFSLDIGDSVEIVYAITGALGGDRIRNIDYLRWLTKYLREAYPDLTSLRQYESEEPQPPVDLPASVAIWHNYPNPFNAGTSIRFQLPDVMPVRLTVYDVLGREIRQLVNGMLQAGTHVAQWDGTNTAGTTVGSGVYFYRLQSGGMDVTRSMIFQK
jgi:hypothetical protein